MKERKTMTTIKNYDSRSNLSSFQLGSMYTFYISNVNKNHLIKIDKNDIEEYVKMFNDVIENNVDLVKISNKHLAFSRVVGMVINKHKSTTPNDVDQITVMFKTSTNEYVLNKYVVNSYNVFMNDKNYVCPAAVI